MDDMRTPLRGIGPPGDSEVFGLTMEDNHRYATWDAAYVLGSLSGADRREFEEHMAGCPQCREAVAELSGMPALLSRLDHAEVAAINESGTALGTGSAAPEMSPELLPSLLAAVRFRRRRSRLTTWVASAAAAVVLGLGVFFGVQTYSSAPAQQVTASAEPMAQVGTNLLTSTVSVTNQHWGTFINLRCVCLAPPDAHHDTLAMVVVGRDGSKTQLATWVAVPGHTATPAGSISMPVDQIAAVQVVAADSGQVLLQRSL
jgi:anti-sigma factor RsiW